MKGGGQQRRAGGGRSTAVLVLRVLYTEPAKLGVRRKRNKRFDLTRCTEQGWKIGWRETLVEKHRETYTIKVRVETRRE